MTTPMKSRYALLRLIAMLPIVTGLLAAFGFTSKAAEIRIQDKLPSAYTPTDPPAETAEKTASPENEDYDLLLVVDGEVTDFKTAYLQSYLFLVVMNWFDGIMLDRVWVGHSKIWEIKGMEGIPYIKPWKTVLTKRGLATILYLIIALVTAGIVVLVGKIC